MLDYADSHWPELCGGYRMPYDPRPALQLLQTQGGAETTWDPLWNELHHQGDVDVASYAAVTALAHIQQERRDLGWNVYALVATIETERHRKSNPPVPTWLAPLYRDAWTTLRESALHELRDATEPVLVRSALAVVALSRGLRTFGAILSDFDEAELIDILDEQLGWSEMYEGKGSASQAATDGNVRRAPREASREFLDDLDSTVGAVPDAELNRVRREWPKR